MDTPIMVTPNGATFVNPNLLLEWEAVSGANLYRIQIFADALITDKIYEGWTSNIFKDGWTAFPQGTFYWHVRAENGIDVSSYSTSRSFIVVAITPVADFSGTPQTTEPGTGMPQGPYPLVVQYTDLSTNVPTSWLWTFGDGSTSTEQNPVHTYVLGGIFNVSLTATNAAGSNTRTQNGYIYVVVPPPSAPLETFVPVSNAVNVPILTAFSWGASPTAGVTYDLQVCQGATITGTFVVNLTGITTLTKTLTTALTNGTQYTWQVRATNAGGSSAWSTARSFTTIIAFVDSTARFSVDVSSGVDSLPVHFTNESTGDIGSFVWHFGDGTTDAVNMNPTHIYSVGTFFPNLELHNMTNSYSETWSGGIQIVVAAPTTTPSLVVNVLRSFLYKGQNTQVQALYTNNMGIRSDVTSLIAWQLPSGINITDKTLTTNSTGRHNIIGSYMGVSAIAVAFVYMQGVKQASQSVDKKKRYNDVYSQAKAEVAAMNKKRRK